MELKAKENELKTLKTIAHQKIAAAIHAITKVNQVVQVASTSLDIYSKHKNDQAKLDVLSEAIRQAENKLQGLKQYENKIYNTIATTRGDIFLPKCGPCIVLSLRPLL